MKIIKLKYKNDYNFEQVLERQTDVKITVIEIRGNE